MRSVVFVIASLLFVVLSNPVSANEVSSFSYEMDGEDELISSSSLPDWAQPAHDDDDDDDGHDDEVDEGNDEDDEGEEGDVLADVTVSENSDDSAVANPADASAAAPAEASSHNLSAVDGDEDDEDDEDEDDESSKSAMLDTEDSRRRRRRRRRGRRGRRMSRRVFRKIKRVCRKTCRAVCRGRGRRCRRSCRGKCQAAALRRLRKRRSLGLGFAAARKMRKLVRMTLTPAQRLLARRNRISKLKAESTAFNQRISTAVQKYATEETKRLIKWFIQSYLNKDAVALARPAATPRALRPNQNVYEPEPGPTPNDPEPFQVRNVDRRPDSPAKRDDVIPIPGLLFDKKPATVPIIPTRPQ